MNNTKKNSKEYAIELKEKIKSLDEKNLLVIAGVATGLELAESIDIKAS